MNFIRRLHMRAVVLWWLSNMNAIKEVKTITDLSRAYRQHVHDELSIVHVWSGATAARIDGKTVPISGECLVLITPGIAHACNPVPESGWQYTQALLDPQVCRDLPLAAPYRVVASTDGLRASFLALREDRDASVPHLMPDLEAALAGASVAPIGRPAHPAALRRVMAFLKAHPGSSLSLEVLCEVAGLSRYHLVRSFKQAYGLTPHACHLNLRVNEAKARLRLGQDLATVALECGFCDQSHFTRVFARCVGMPPASYQKSTAIPSKTLLGRRSQA
jgi:AraC-like DNA-binding protein